MRANGITVVATGEGADELFWGYDLFKEVVAARAATRATRSAPRELLDELYPYLGGRGRAAAARPGQRFLLETGAADDPLGSHLTRGRGDRGGARRSTAPRSPPSSAPTPLARRACAPSLPPAFGGWSALERAAWLELTTLLEPYLLAAQGDRVAMAHGVEGRYPFLDHRVFAHSARAAAGAQARPACATRSRCASSPRELLPAEIAARRKQPYRAPEVAPFFGDRRAGVGRGAALAAALAETGDLGPASASRACCAAAAPAGRPGSARGWRWSAILSTQLWHRAVLRRGRRARARPRPPSRG